MRARQRLSLQLTPLLDMLLIIVFAQYLEIREKQVLKKTEANTAIVDLEETRARVKALLAEEELLKLQMQKMQQKSLQTQSELERTVDQQHLLSGLMTEMFQIPPAELDRLLNAAQVPSLERSPKEMARVKEQFQQLSARSSGRIIEHILSYDEIRKRCDVWEFHVDARGIATIKAGNRETRIRIPTLTNDDVNVPGFVSEVYAWYRSLPQPKSLVVILLTYDRESRISVMEAVRRSLPVLVAQMQADHLGQVRFEYADLGFRLD